MKEMRQHDLNTMKLEINRINSIQKYINREVKDDNLRGLILRPLFEQKLQICKKLYLSFVNFVVDHTNSYNPSDLQFLLDHPVRKFMTLAVIDKKQSFRLQIGDSSKSKAILIPYKMLTNPKFHSKIVAMRKRLRMKISKNEKITHNSFIFKPMLLGRILKIYLKKS